MFTIRKSFNCESSVESERKIRFIIEELVSLADLEASVEVSTRQRRL